MGKRYILSGGGTGGHITPILAVAHELKLQEPDCAIVYVGERNSAFAELTANHEAIDEVRTIWAGKFRRYHGESALTRLFDIKTNLLNIRDVFYFLVGTVQSVFLLRHLLPDAILLKGGFVGVPVGLAAALCRRPFMTHDSDAMPGLANRLVARWARKHAVALLPEQYPYPLTETVQVGVIVEPHFHLVSTDEQSGLKEQINVPATAQLLLITGGSSGAVRLNEAVVKIIDMLLASHENLYVVHQVGKGKLGVYTDYSHPRLQVVEFMRPMHVYTGAADIVVSRASGNTVAELGVQHKPVIVVASPFLAGGHQLKNAAFLEDHHAAISVPETHAGADEQKLLSSITQLLSDEGERTRLADALQSITVTDAAARVAKLLSDIAHNR